MSRNHRDTIHVNDDWQVVPPKKSKKLKKKPKAKPVQHKRLVYKKKIVETTLSVSDTSPNNIAVFEQFDSIEADVLTDPKVQQILRRPISSTDLDTVIETDRTKETVTVAVAGTEADWDAISEATAVIRDQHLEAIGREPIFSANKRKPVACTCTCTEAITVADPGQDVVPEKPSELPIELPLRLPVAVALVKEEKYNHGRFTACISVMTSLKKLWGGINYLDGTTGDHPSVFMAAIESIEGNSQDELADRIFEEINTLSQQRFNPRGRPNPSRLSSHDLRRLTGELVERYNAIHPIWSFVRVTRTRKVPIDRSQITIPYLRSANGRVYNVIDINMRHPNFSSRTSTRGLPFNLDFLGGYLLYLFLDWIGGNMGDINQHIACIAFHRTIVFEEGKYYLGFRIRVLMETTDTTIIAKCRKYIEQEFPKKINGAESFVVNILSPKR